MKFFWILPLSPRDLRRAALTSAALALMLCVLIERYWSFFRLDTPWSDYGLFGLVLPVVFVLGTLACLAITVKLRGRQAKPRVAAWGGTLVVAGLVVCLFALELARTRSARSGEGERAGELAPFFRSLVRGR